MQPPPECPVGRSAAVPSSRLSASSMLPARRRRAAAPALAPARRRERASAPPRGQRPAGSGGDSAVSAAERPGQSRCLPVWGGRSVKSLLGDRRGLAVCPGAGGRFFPLRARGCAGRAVLVTEGGGGSSRPWDLMDLVGISSGSSLRCKGACSDSFSPAAAGTAGCRRTLGGRGLECVNLFSPVRICRLLLI